jgi:lysophospholipase L1-like esterase
LELFVGSSDLGPVGPDTHLYLGNAFNSLTPTVGNGYLDFSSPANSLGIIALPSSTSFSSFTVLCAAKKVVAGAGSSYQAYFSSIANYQNFTAFMEHSQNPVGFFNGTTAGVLGGVDGSPTYGLWEPYGQGWHMYALQYDSVNHVINIWLDDILVTSQSFSPGSLSAWDFYVASTNTLGANYQIAGVALWQRFLSATEMRNAFLSMQFRLGQHGNSMTAIKNFVVAEGDSITAISYSYVDVYYTTPPSTLFMGLNNAVSGSTINNLNLRASEIDSCIPPNKGTRKFVLSVLIGANDLGVSTWLTNLASYLDARRSAGWYVVLCTVLPQTASGFNTARDSANPTLRTWVGVHCDAICDFGNLSSTMGADAAASNTTLYPDGEHPSATGFINLANNNTFTTSQYANVMNGVL